MLNLFYSFFHYLESIIGSFPVLLTFTTVALSIKLFLLFFLISKGMRSSKVPKPWIYLTLFLLGSMVEDVAWVLKLSQTLFFPAMDYRITLFLIRIAWAFVTIRYQALALFIESFSEKRHRLAFRQKLFMGVSATIAIFFIFIAFYDLNCIRSADKTSLESSMQTMTSIYTLIPLMLSSLCITIWKIRKTVMPRILKRQVKVFIKFLMFPILLSDFIQMYPFHIVATTVANTYAVIGISTLITSYAIFHSARKIMGLRFLNFQGHVQSPKRFSFIHDFKNILDQFSQVTNKKELGHITQNFFKEAFSIPARRTTLYLRKTTENGKNDTDPTPIKIESKYEAAVENFIGSLSNESNVSNFIRKHKVIIADEIEFSNFYEDDNTRKQMIGLLTNISADIFIPIFEKQTIIAYIIVERYARINNENKNAPFYSNVERDQMVVFSSYLGNILKLLQSKNLKSLMRQEKELKEELYRKHQEINQYKESIRSFLKNTQQKKIGIIFYKNRKFTFGNQTAQEFIPVKLNTHDGHPITKKLKQAANQVLEYKSPQTCFIQGQKGEKLVVSGIPNIENNNVIMIVYYPEISDILKRKINLLKDPTKWDYLLYLETTKSGQLVNQLIPGNGETLLHFKINLLKTALSKKAIHLDMLDQDLIPTVEILHHISLRETLYILDLQKPSTGLETAVKLFGINPIFGFNKTYTEKPLLEKLDKNGTLFIKNIHFLELETQQYLAEFIKYGFFRTFKSDQKTFSSVRIICSTTVNLQHAVQEGRFCESLFNELKKTSLTMPSLLTLSEDELDNLTRGFTQQAIKTNEFQHLLELTKSEKKRLAQSRPASLQELKTKIQQLLIKKSKQHAIYEEAQFDPAYDVSDPELVEAVRLGKHALKDHKIMEMLWNKFKNQNKIANLLGVNRSSVNRRCKEYNLI